MTRLALLALALAACARGPAQPGALDLKNDACTRCRMAISDARFASQLAAPGEEPRFFDDLGCLRDWLKAKPALPRGAVAFVADHRTRQWVRAAQALYARNPGLETPMSSHLIAHADAASRAGDPAAQGGEAVAPAELFGPAGPPDGAR